MIQDGSKVDIHYTLTVEDEVVDTSRGGEPLSYVQGEGRILPALEARIEAMSEGERAVIVLAPDEAYGERDPDAMQQVPLAAFSGGRTIEVGDVVEGRTDDGEEFQAMVAAVAEEEVTLDFNHPLAGKTLQFDVEVVTVAAA